MDLRETGWGGVEWIHLAQDRDQWRAVVNTMMNFSSSHGGENDVQSCLLGCTAV
jgi:hypothetical protein